MSSVECGMWYCVVRNSTPSVWLFCLQKRTPHIHIHIHTHMSLSGPKSEATGRWTFKSFCVPFSPPPSFLMCTCSLFCPLKFLYPVSSFNSPFTHREGLQKILLFFSFSLSLIHSKTLRKLLSSRPWRGATSTHWWPAKHHKDVNAGPFATKQIGTGDWIRTMTKTMDGRGKKSGKTWGHTRGKYFLLFKMCVKLMAF